MLHLALLHAGVALLSLGGEALVRGALITVMTLVGGLTEHIA